MAKTLKLDQIRKPLGFNVQKGTSIDLRDLVCGTYGDVVDFDVWLPSKGKNLQRPLVWTLQQKQEFVKSVLKGIEIASVSVIIYRDDVTRKTNSQVIRVIDGKQRISTLISFCNNEFPLTIDEEDYFFDDMELAAQQVLDFFWFRGDIVYEYPDAMISDDDRIAWFEMINFAGTPQDMEHLNDLKS